MRVKVGIDGKPLLPPRTGVYRYTQGLLAGLSSLPQDQVEVVVVSPKKPHRTVFWVLWHLQRATSRGFSLFHFPFYYPPLFPRCPVTVAVHDVLVLSHPHWFPRAWANTLRWLIPMGVRQAAAIVTGTQWVAQEVAERCGVPRERLRVIPYGVQGSLFCPPSEERVVQARSRFALERPYVLMVGALEPRRGVDLLLPAVAQLRQLFPHLELVLVGNMRSPVPQLAQPPPWVRLLGYVEDAWLPALYGGASAVVAPSRGEGFDLPLLEALACGAVAVASDIPVHREVFASAVRLFPAGEVEALRQALQEVLEDTALRQRLRQAGLLLASRFTWERAAQEHLRLWQEVACAPPRW